MADIQLSTIEEALEDFKAGKFLIVVDDEDRENEGDLITAAELITPEKINYMLQKGRGVLCAPVTKERCRQLHLDHQVQSNTSVLGTPFTVTVDLLEGCTTGVSTHDRAATVRALADPEARPEWFGRPGHINPLYAQDRGVLARAGHTEAAVDLARMAGFQPVACLIEILNEDGTMARMPQLKEFAAQDYYHQRPHCLSPQRGESHRARRRSEHAHRIWRFPPHSLSPKEQWTRTRGPLQRRLEAW